MIDLSDVREARARIATSVRRTPLVRVPELGTAGAAVAVKAEHLQRTGAFKFRGIFNRVCLAEAARRRRWQAGPDRPGGHYLTVSSGNAALGLAVAARLHDARCTVVVPNSITPTKRAAIDRLGARTVDGGADVAEVFATGRRITDAEGAEFVHPYDDWDVIAGHGGIPLEILEDAPDTTRIVVPTSGGSLLAAVGLVVKTTRPDIRVIGVQPESMNSVQLSRAAGRVVETPQRPTIADALVARRCGENTLQLISRYVDDVVVVSDDAALAAMTELWQSVRLAVEPSAAVPLAALRSGAVSPGGLTTIITTGGNVDLSFFERASAQARATGNLR